MLFREVLAVDFKNCLKPVNKLCGKIAEQSYAIIIKTGPLYNQKCMVGDWSIYTYSVLI
jgi:hypothetical protein